MGIFADIADQWQIADDAFSFLEQQAFIADDEPGFDKATKQRKWNDQAYFLFLFTRFEDEVNKAAKIVVANRVSGAAWQERRIWEAWSKNDIKEVALMSKVQVLLDKSRTDYATVKDYYEGRNDVAHGRFWTEQFVVPAIAQTMDAIVMSFPTQ